MPRTRDILRANLVRLRKEYGLKVKDVAAILGVTSATIYKMERGRGCVSPDYLDILLEHYNLPADYFFYNPSSLSEELWEIPPEILFVLKRAAKLTDAEKRSLHEFVCFQIREHEQKRRVVS